MQPSAQTATLRRAWWLLLILSLVLGWLLSVVQPLGRTPDEPAHMQYVAFLAQAKRLPVWQVQGGGEAGYQAQHPPLFYSLAAIPYQLAAALPGHWRWQVVRWAILVAEICALWWLCRRGFPRIFASDKLALAAGATVLLMPLALLYTGYVNPDGLVFVLATAGFFGSCGAARRGLAPREALLLGAICGLGLLTKLSAAPLLVLALAAPWLRPVDRETRVRDSVLILSTALLLAVPYYLRTTLLYGSPFIHTQGAYGTGWDLANVRGPGFAAWLTWRETYLSTWVQRGWLPQGGLEYLFNATIVLVPLLAALGWLRLRQRGTQLHSPPRGVLVLALLHIGLTFAGQQWAFWRVDVEFNAGGRYMLATLAPISLLLVQGLQGWANSGRYLLMGWLLALPFMNLASAWNIWEVLNPRYAPNWKIFHFPPGEERD